MLARSSLNFAGISYEQMPHKLMQSSVPLRMLFNNLLLADRGLMAVPRGTAGATYSRYALTGHAT